MISGDAQAMMVQAYSSDLRFRVIKKQAFSKFKALLRKAAARTIPDLWAAIAETITLFIRRECASYFQAAGYEPA